MSLDNIQLSPLLMQQLYSKSLVDISDHPTANPGKIADPGIAISRLGNNEKNILVIVDEKDAPFLEDAQLALLVSILTACKLSLADIALVNFHKNPAIHFNMLNEQLHPSAILLFGIDAARLDFPLIFPHFQLTSYNGQTYLASPPLQQIGADTQLKKQLWTQLQKQFIK